MVDGIGIDLGDTARIHVVVFPIYGETKNR